MAPVTTPGTKVIASKVDPDDPKQILKDRLVHQYQYLSESDTMAREVGKIDKSINDMTKAELLTPVADEQDENRASGKHLQPPTGDPLTWKFDPRTQELLDAYHAKFEPEESLLADDVEHFCICNGPDDGRPMIECSNGRACLMGWHHLDCIGMGLDEVPEEQEDWFCKRCVDNKLGKLRKNAPKSISRSIVKKSNADRIKHYDAVEQAAAQSTAKDEKAKRKKQERNQKSHTRQKQKQKQMQNALTIDTTPSEPLTMSTPSPGTPKAWTAELDKSFVEDPEVAATYNLRSVASAKAAIRGATNTANNVPANTTTKATTTADEDLDGDVGMSDGASETGGKRSKGSWTAEEKAHLVDCVKAANAAGLSGEALWSDVYPNMLARGVNRPLGGMRMTWLRELRQQENVDERRRKNAGKMRTAVQKSKREKEAKRGAGEDVIVKDEEEVHQEKEERDAADAAALAVMPTKPIAGRTRAESR